LKSCIGNGTIEQGYGTARTKSTSRTATMEEIRYKSSAAKDIVKERYLKYCKLD
jgi:hypothetical protein